MDNPFSNIMFKKVASGLCRLSYNGSIAVKSGDGGYKTYNLKNRTLVNCSQFVLPIADDFFFVMPTNKVKVGDIIIANGKPKCVIGTDDHEIKVVNYENNTVEIVLPERHVFLGKTYFYGKIVSMLGNNVLKGGKGRGGLMKLLMMSKLFGGSGGALFGGQTGAASTGNGEQTGGFLNAMLPMMMFGGGSNALDGLFNFDFEDDEDDDDIVGSMIPCVDEDEEEADEAASAAADPAPVAKRKRK